MADNTVLDGADGMDKPEQAAFSPLTLVGRTCWRVYWQYYFLIMAAFSILFAALVPDMFRKGGWMASQYTVSYGGNIAVFLITGLTLKTEALLLAIASIKLNFLIQSNVFMLTPLLFFGVASALRGSHISSDLLDGVVVLGCLPTTINMCVVMTTSSGGRVPAALFNATLANILGIFLSPLYILAMLGVEGDVSLPDVFLSLTYKVVIPCFIGQMIQNFGGEVVSEGLAMFKPYATRTSETLLLFIVLSTFSTTFHEGVTVGTIDIILMMLLMIALQLLVYALVWYGELGAWLGLRLTLQDQVACFFCSSHKTMALGIPLITAIYAGSSKAGIYSIPLLMYHPLQIVFGSFLAPQFKRRILKEERQEQVASAVTVVDEVELAAVPRV